jgi:hypothetical protein
VPHGENVHQATAEFRQLLGRIRQYPEHADRLNAFRLVAFAAIADLAAEIDEQRKTGLIDESHEALIWSEMAENGPDYW